MTAIGTAYDRKWPVTRTTPSAVRGPTSFAWTATPPRPVPDAIGGQSRYPASTRTRSELEVDAGLQGDPIELPLDDTVLALAFRELECRVHAILEIEIGGYLIVHRMARLPASGQSARPSVKILYA